jgi:hypothetical protein
MIATRSDADVGGACHAIACLSSLRLRDLPSTVLEGCDLDVMVAGDIRLVSPALPCRRPGDAVRYSLMRLLREFDGLGRYINHP